MPEENYKIMGRDGKSHLLLQSLPGAVLLIVSPSLPFQPPWCPIPILLSPHRLWYLAYDSSRTTPYSARAGSRHPGLLLPVTEGPVCNIPHCSQRGLLDLTGKSLLLQSMGNRRLRPCSRGPSFRLITSPVEAARGNNLQP